MFHQLIPNLRPWLIAAAAAAVTIVAAPTGVVLADNHISNTGAAVLGGIAGLAVGAAIVDSTHPHVYYPPRYQPNPYPQPYPYAQPYPAYYPRPVYRPAYAAPFAPAPGVTCYPDRGLCFKYNGKVANQWTASVFGY